jgi:hypothetical protein
MEINIDDKARSFEGMVFEIDFIYSKDTGEIAVRKAELTIGTYINMHLGYKDCLLDGEPVRGVCFFMDKLIFRNRLVARFCVAEVGTMQFT